MTLNAPLFAALAPEFASYDSTALTLVAAEAERFVNQTVWKEKADLGLVYMTAHMLKMAKEAEYIKVTSEKVGDLSRSYDKSGAPGDTELDQTQYGKEFKRVRRTLQISPFVVT